MYEGGWIYEQRKTKEYIGRPFKELMCIKSVKITIARVEWKRENMLPLAEQDREEEVLLQQK